MTPAEARAIYRRQMDEVGESVLFSRGASSATVKARVTGYSAEEMAAGIDMAARKVIVMHSDLESAGFPVPLRKGDNITIDGRLLRFEEVDSHTRRTQGEIIAYEGMAAG